MIPLIVNKQTVLFRWRLRRTIRYGPRARTSAHSKYTSYPICLVLLTPNVNIDACEKLKFKPTITLIIVGKRHHVRFFPCVQGEGTSDRSGNCVAGTVVDSDVINPVEFDFYLLSHGGILGTSRPAHYNILMDENRFTYVTLDVSPARRLTMLTPCPVLTAYNPSHMPFVTCMREPLAPSPYPHLSIVILVHCLHILPLTGFYARC